MNAAQLKASILQQAIEGKLVPQLPEEGVVEQIGDAPTEVPFEIPASWKWYTLGNLIEYGNCKQVAGKDITSSTWVLDLEDIEKNTGKIIEKKRNVKSTSNKNVFEEGYVLYSKLRPYLNKVVIADETGVCTTEIIPINVKTAKVPLLPHYLQFSLMSPYFLNYANRCSYGVKMPRLGTNDAKAAYIPLPPLAEQKRIVAKIEELMPLVEEYGKAYDKLQELNDELPVKLKASILQEAIQGKLVPQLPEDGVVNQIGDVPAELPFEIPDSWIWVKFEHTCNCLDSMRVPIKQKERENLNKQYPYYGATGVIDYVDKYIFDGSFLLIGEDGANLLSKSKDNAFIATGKFWVNNHAHIFDSNKVSELKYLAIVINALNLNRYITGSAQPKLTQKNLFSIPVPLPPLAEQKRIVAKVEALFEQIDLMTK